MKNTPYFKKRFDTYPPGFDGVDGLGCIICAGGKMRCRRDTACSPVMHPLWNCNGMMRQAKGKISARDLITQCGDTHCYSILRRFAGFTSLFNASIMFIPLVWSFNSPIHIFSIEENHFSYCHLTHVWCITDLNFLCETVKSACYIFPHLPGEGC